MKTFWCALATVAAAAVFSEPACAVPHTWEIVGVDVTHVNSQKPGFTVEVEPALERRPVVLDDGEGFFYLRLLRIWTNQTSVEAEDTFGSLFTMDIRFRVDSSRILTVPFAGETWVRQAGIDNVQGGMLTSEHDHHVRHQGNVLLFRPQADYFNAGNLELNELSPGKENGGYVYTYLVQVSSSATPVPDVSDTALLFAVGLLCMALATPAAGPAARGSGAG